MICIYKYYTKRGLVPTEEINLRQINFRSGSVQGPDLKTHKPPALASGLLC